MPEADEKKLLSLDELFHAMMAVDGSRAYLVGRDNWRRDITGLDGKKVDALENIDPSLAIEVSRQAQSKGGHWNNPEEWNIWPAVHIGLLLPAVGQVLKHYSDERVALPYEEAVRDFSALPYIVNHCKEYEALSTQYGYAGKKPDDIKDEWRARLQSYFDGADLQKPLAEILKLLPDDLREKAETALKHQDHKTAENDSLVGRMILAYLGEQGVPYEHIGIDPRVKDYLRPLHRIPQTHPSKPLHERILDVHVDALPQLIKDIPVLGYTPDSIISMDEFSKAYRWFGSGKVVEMAKPDLVGAAQLSFSELSGLFQKLESEQGLTFHQQIEMPRSKELFRQTQSTQTLGRLTLVQDLIESTYNDGQQGGSPLRKIVKKIWSDQERLAAWGNTDVYVPESRAEKRGFDVFKQDIANSLYSAGLFEEKHENAGRAAGLKSLALDIKKASSLGEMNFFVQQNAHVIEGLVQHWSQQYPGEPRTDIAQFISQTFGLEKPRFIAVTQEEINLGLEGSQFKASDRKYHVHYREATKSIDSDVLIPRGLPKGTFAYNTETQDGIPTLEITRANGQVVNVPVPARGSYDAFGATGDAHAGEIVGYGCATHHATLTLALAEVAALGASKEAMQKLSDDFMKINPGKHHRDTLANFQVEQIWTAFNEGRVISQTDYLNAHPEIKNALLDAPGHEHTKAYLEQPDKEPLAAHATRARLAYGYKELYDPAHPLGTRDSWYETSVDAHLAPTGKELQWQALQSPDAGQALNKHAGVSR